MGTDRRYNSVLQPSLIEYTVQKSRFIGRCHPVANEEEAQRILEEVRKKHWDATHNCYAYILGERSETARFSDDGEPGGTAGMPMLDTLKQRALTNALVIATRYFGGVLLGTGGLVRAYGKTAADAAEAALPITMLLAARYEMEIDYPLWGRIEHYLRNASYSLSSVEFAQVVRAAALVPLSQEERFIKEVADLTDGRIDPLRAGERFELWQNHTTA